MKDLDILWRRILAYIFDCSLILAFAICLGLIVLVAQNYFRFSLYQSAIIGHLIAFFTLTLPALLYFSATESSSKKASFGKRVFGLQVLTIEGRPVSFKRAFSRAIILLLPWEIAHSAIWYGSAKPFLEPPSIGALMMMIVAQGLVLFYLIMAIITPKQSIAERILGIVIVREP